MIKARKTKCQNSYEKINVPIEKRKGMQENRKGKGSR